MFCAIVSHPADSVVSVLNKESGSTAMGVLKKLGPKGQYSSCISSIITVFITMNNQTRSLDPPLGGAPGLGLLSVCCSLSLDSLSSFLAVQLEVLESLACESSLPAPQPLHCTGNPPVSLAGFSQGRQAGERTQHLLKYLLEYHVCSV